MHNDNSFVIFELNHLLCAITLGIVKEIVKTVDITEVYDDRKYIEGVINLRGQIIPILNMRKRFQIDKQDASKPKIIVIYWNEEIIGLLVDQIIGIQNLQHQVDNENALNFNITNEKNCFLGFSKERETDQFVGILNVENILLPANVSV